LIGPLQREGVGARRRAGAAAAALTLALASGSAWSAADPAAELEQRTRKNARLRALVELSGAGDLPYLVLDPAQNALRLMLDAVVLREYPVQRLEIGHPRVLFVFEREPPADWAGRLFSGGQLDPAPSWGRRELVPPAAESAPAEGEQAEPAIIPPTVEEAYPAPPRYRVRYDDGLTLEIVADQAAAGGGLGEWLRDVGTALAPGGETLRLRVVLPAADAAALYRSLAPDGRLVVLPPV
jgi:hypothetical protein